ncbi:MAG: YkvA family protein [Bacteroidota bacterium]|jgi:uncharacterized membrane protein YkvA (DUF1232 family)|nr:DUF1232 domain-containing protein [Ignavibacteria bacterium]MCU7499222.1 DUF1232 domain-containing protein [Ignavibacteria bacterium]MCU7513650.1 DUF1232 domain-containing protein [Ignavibacteria bacterium]MCU7520101.1 DUF1232 domain-containing protein [Ignavibacteria bacterium]MCU7524604.1 DUF1232 domain-containing protein [Ignavibacteria bacterium]
MSDYRPDLDELERPYTSEEEYRKGEEFVSEELWTKLEKVGKRISFTRDIKALFRYMRDPYVSWHRKAIVVGALIYFISPIDAIPDLAPLIGYLDDLGVITAVLKFLGSELIPYYERRFV